MINLSIFNFNKQVNNKRKLLIVLLVIFSLLGVFFVVGGKIKSIGRNFLYVAKNDKGYFLGDLYNYAEVSDFKEHIKLVQYKGEADPARGEIVMYGDSFFNNGFDSQPLPVELAEKTHKQITFYQPPVDGGGPIEYLKRFNYQKGPEKFFVWENVERKSVIRAKEFSQIAKNQDGVVKDKKVSMSVSIFDRIQRRMVQSKTILFDRTNVEYFIKNNLIIKPFRVWLKEAAYNLFGEIDSMVATYSKKHKMLFFNEEVVFNNDRQKDLPENLNEVSDDIALIGKKLKTDYNLDMIYIIIPNKYSIYPDYIGNGPAYDDFIPELQKRLSDRNVNFVDSYGMLKNYRLNHQGDPLYYRGDTHYTYVGKKLLLEELIKKFSY